MPTYICNTAQHNKFWTYELDGSGVSFEWGRVGSSTQTLKKSFSTPSAASAYAMKKVAEKQKKGYQLKTEEEVKQEVKTARMLGTQYKISKMLFTHRVGKELNILYKYDPAESVYVEVMNSWTKDIHRLLLTKKDSSVISGGVSESIGLIECGTIRSISNWDKEYKFVQAVREVLKSIAGQVKEVLKSVKFAALGVRSLFDDDEELEMENEASTQLYSQVVAQAASSGVGEQVVRRFAALGSRSLDL